MIYSHMKFIQEFPEEKQKEANKLLEECILDERIEEKIVQ